MIQKGGAGRGRRRDGGHRHVLQGHVPAGARFDARHRDVSLGLGERHSRRGGQQRTRPLHLVHRLRVDLEHRRQQSASRRRLPRRRRQDSAQSSRTPRSSRSAATIPRTCGRSCRATRTRPAATSSPSRTTAISRTASCSRRSTPSRASRSRASTRRRAPSGNTLRGDADEGRRRGASVPFADRRVRRLREMGQVQPQHERAKGEQHAPVRIRAIGAADRAATRSQARHQSLQGRHDRFDRHAHRSRHRRGGQFLRQARGHRAERQAHGAPGRLLRQELHPGLVSSPHRAMRACGRPRTRAKRSSMRWSAGKPMRPRARA